MRYLVVIAALVALVFFLTHSARAKRVLQVIGAVLVIYAILKMTGVFEMISPTRDGVY